MRSEASLGRGATAPPQAAVTQQVISRCVCLACGAFSKKSVRTGLRVVPGREEEEGNWLISSRFLLFCWSKSTEGWLPILGGGIIWPLVGPGEAETICCLSPMSHSEGQRSKGKGQRRGHGGHTGPALQLGLSNCGWRQDEEAGVPSARRRRSE